MSTSALPHDANLRARFGELKPALATQAAVIEADRCLNCFDAPCTAACPTHIDVPGFIKRIASGNMRGSAMRILDANILGASCARVCPVDVLCEGACVMVRQNRKPIQIGQLQRHAMDAFWASGEAVPVKAPGTSKLRVACIGSGPASLACAAELCRQGAQATVIERRELPGGLNTYGVAEYKLRAVDSVREVEMIRRLGVEFRCGVEVDSASALEALETEFDFIFWESGWARCSGWAFLAKLFRATMERA
ncbi:MAG: NAD(P)-binding protein [Terracidiphilus sp.]